MSHHRPDPTPVSRAAPKAVFFDFSSTLFRLGEISDWLRAVDTATLPEDVRQRLPEVWPGGPLREVPVHLQLAYAERDLGPRRHREAYVGMMEHIGVRDAALAQQLYDWARRPASWRPYPDTLAALHRLRAAGIPTVLISNIAWDVRPVLAAHGALEQLRAVVLSFEQEVIKPDRRIFDTACALAGVAAEQAAMVGDNEYDDGGAAAIGIAYQRVEPLPVTQRTCGLQRALDALGVPSPLPDV